MSTPLAAVRQWYSEKAGLGTRMFWPGFARTMIARSTAPEQEDVITTSCICVCMNLYVYVCICICVRVHVRAFVQ